ncbi:hypothetical protein DERF_012066, partial [Dermatophagoides farinae]
PPPPAAPPPPIGFDSATGTFDFGCCFWLISSDSPDSPDSAEMLIGRPPPVAFDSDSEILIGPPDFGFFPTDSSSSSDSSNSYESSAPGILDFGCFRLSGLASPDSPDSAEMLIGPPDFGFFPTVSTFSSDSSNSYESPAPGILNCCCFRPSVFVSSDSTEMSIGRPPSDTIGFNFFNAGSANSSDSSNWKSPGTFDFGCFWIVSPDTLDFDICPVDSSSSSDSSDSSEPPPLLISRGTFGFN